MKDTILFLSGLVLVMVAVWVVFIEPIAALVALVVGFVMVWSGWRIHNTIHIIGNLKRE